MRGTLVLGAAWLVMVGCRYDATGLGSSDGSASDDTAALTSGSSSTSSGAASTGSSGGDTSTGATPPGDTSSSSSSSTGAPETTGPDVPALVDDGLLARWYIDESNSGQGPPAVIDHHPPGVDVPLVYGGEYPIYEGFEGNRGLRWGEVGLNGRAVVPIAGTKLERALPGATQATFELVLIVNQVMPELSRFLHIGTGSGGGDFAIGSPFMDRLALRWGGSTLREFEIDFGDGRRVLHVVVDTQASDPDDRLRAYVDGVALVPTGAGAPDQDDGLPINGMPSLTLGNRTDGTRSFRGRLQYAAIYTAVLDQAQIENNRDVLLASDDAPWR